MDVNYTTRPSHWQFKMKTMATCGCHTLPTNTPAIVKCWALKGDWKLIVSPIIWSDLGAVKQSTLVNTLLGLLCQNRRCKYKKSTAFIALEKVKTYLFWCNSSLWNKFWLLATVNVCISVEFILQLREYELGFLFHNHNGFDYLILYPIFPKSQYLLE